ncbi:unnamed protein product [Arctia plantaginis]|uniref:Uncharacterized protein n=1 Tax=Arctia plantaginis TaxID=874455 RepID=A0A8S1BIS3_ARCPL|nr:unnamed protein product [Arctia plantaginis]
MCNDEKAEKLIDLCFFGLLFPEYFGARESPLAFGDQLPYREWPPGSDAGIEGCARTSNQFIDPGHRHHKAAGILVSVQG